MKTWHSCSENEWKTCTKGVNCYSYILDRPDYYWAVPGKGFARTEIQKYFDSFNIFFDGISMDDFQRTVTEGATSDGLLQIREPENRDGYRLTSVAFPENEIDFHWYRQEADGTWNHKDGWREVRNTDDMGNVIRDPRNAASKHYPVFGGFFLVPDSGVILEQKFPVES